MTHDRTFARAAWVAELASFDSSASAWVLDLDATGGAAPTPAR
jgi:hypothetical protein